MRPVKAAVSLLLLVASVCTIGTAAAAGVYRLGPVHDSEPELLIPNPNATTGNCGVERWSVKTGTDPDAGQVDITTSTPASITALAAIQPPASLPSDQRIAPTETTLFTVDATLTEYKLEADSDYHLVIKDSSGHTMIAEIPDPACVGIASPFLGDIQTVRQVFDNQYAATGAFQTANVPVCLTGVGFFDFIHGQTGVAPNGIELHPVLGVQFTPSACQAWGGATPPAAQFLAPDPPASAITGTSTQFKIQCTAGSYALASWRLDFGDGSPPATGVMQGTATGTATASHTYARSGARLVATLTCADRQNTTSVPVTLAVSVTAPPSGGSGGMTVWTLLALGWLSGCLMLRTTAARSHWRAR